MKEWQKVNKTTTKKKAASTKPPVKKTYLNEDGAEFFIDSDELVPGSTWDYPGSPYSDEEYDG